MRVIFLSAVRSLPPEQRMIIMLVLFRMPCMLRVDETQLLCTWYDYYSSFWSLFIVCVVACMHVQR